MAKQAAADYSKLTIVQPTPEAKPEPEPRKAKEPSPTLKKRAAHHMTYVSKEFSKAMKRYAVDMECKVHDLHIEALEQWALAHGIREKVRVESPPDEG